MAIATGSLSVVFTGSGVATSLTGPGVVVGVPLASIGGVCGVVSAVSTSVMKKLSAKISKHDRHIMLARSKSNTISDLTSKALRDRVISDTEFSLILAEEAKYEQMKSEITEKKVVVMEKQISEKEKQQIYEEARESFRKN